MCEKLTNLNFFSMTPPPLPHLAKLDFSGPSQVPPILLDEHFNTPPAPHFHTHTLNSFTVCKHTIISEDAVM